MTRERRQRTPDPIATVDLVVVWGIVLVAIILSVGGLVLAALGKTAPEWVGNVS